MLLIDGVRYDLWTPGLEREEFEPIVQEHASDIFGRQSVYLDIKTRLESDFGTKAVPDAFVIHYGQPPCWRIIEVELSKHPLHDHIVSQVGKFISGIGNPSTQKRIADALDSEIRKQDVNLLRLRRAIEPTELYRFLSNLVVTPPVLTIVIEEETPQLKEALNILSYPRIEVVEFQTFTRHGVGLEVHAHLFEPLHQTHSRRNVEQADRHQEGAAGHDGSTRVSVRDLVEEALIEPEQMIYGYHRDRRYEATILPDGRIRLTHDGSEYGSPSAAAFKGVVGHEINGWHWWRTVGENGIEQKLDDLRKRSTKQGKPVSPMRRRKADTGGELRG